MADNPRVNDLNRRISVLTDELNDEISAERQKTEDLSKLLSEVNNFKQQLIEKREYIQRLERKITLGLAVRTVEELPEGSLVERYSKFQESLGLSGVSADCIHPVQLNRVLSASSSDAYIIAFQIS